MQTTELNAGAQSFWDRIAPKYARKPVADQDAYDAKLSRVRSLLKPTDRVLEIGCGTGSTAMHLADSVAHITATDISRGMIKIAQAKQDNATSKNVTFLQVGANDTVDSQPFDAVCAFSLLHLVDDIPGVLQSVRRQLKPGGLFLSKTACLSEVNVFIRAAIVVMRVFGFAPKVTVLNAEMLAKRICEAGFEIEQISYFGANRMSPFIVARKVGL
ncbi:MAG: class I SAM-dependent methyltransferase [Pseudomonadota bacterium]